MKKLKTYLFLSLGTFLVVGCANTAGNESKEVTVSNESASVSKEDTTVANESEEDTTKENSEISQQEEEGNTSVHTDETTETVESSSNAQTSSNEEISQSPKEESQLTAYSTEEIEYARIWLQLGPNQDIDELNVRFISAGTLINPDDETSTPYPEDVIQLAGSRLVDGSITYSSNGDGSINVYNVPLRWDSNNETVDENFMREYTEEVIEKREVVKIDPGNDQDVIRLIQKLNIH